ncbi:MAG TPA: hypothetical protein VMN78_01285 [Longimicrobiales bacterium]|nr:hypothetical protein [Longimicrobiales bacterium]
MVKGGSTLTLASASLLIATFAAGCTPDDQETGSISADDVRAAAERFTPEVRAQLDSGNAAYRRHDWDSALRHYETAAAREPDATAAWFGVYMAQRALGDTLAARDALERARRLAPGATIMHPNGDEP